MALKAKGFFLGIVLLIMAIVSTVFINQIRNKQQESASQTETP